MEMDGEGYQQFLRKNKRAKSGIIKSINSVKEYERFLKNVRNKTDFLKTNELDLEAFINWEGNQIQFSIGVQLKAISNYFDFILNRSIGTSARIYQSQQAKNARKISKKTKRSKINIKNVTEWLLEEENPSIRYRTMRELQELPESDPKLQLAKNQISSYQPVKNMLRAMHPEAYWEVFSPNTKKSFGKGMDYRQDSTHFILGYLAELGMTREDPKIEKAANRYLSLQQPDGDFFRHFSCLYSSNIRTFIQLGFKDDPRLKKTIELMKKSVRYDNGYLCDKYEGKRKRSPVKSCVKGSAKVLFLLGELPELWDESSCKKIAEYFLNRNILYKTTNPETYVNTDAGTTIFPFNAGFGLIDALLPLAKMGYGTDVRIKSAWNHLEWHRTEEGKYICDRIRNNKYWKIGKSGVANKWITFYAYLCLKYKEKVR